jgi:hypothetical protein
MNLAAGFSKLIHAKLYKLPSYTVGGEDPQMALIISVIFFSGVNIFQLKKSDGHQADYQ